MRYQSKYVPIAGIYEVFDVVEQRTIEQSELISRLNEADRQRAGVSRDEFAALHQTVAAQQVQIDGMQKILIGQVRQPAPAQETGDEVYNPDMLGLIVYHGIPGLIEKIAVACEQKHQYYAPDISAFGAWAEVLRAHLPQMREDVRQRLGV